MAASKACITALVVILNRFQDQLSTSYNFYITLNATIAIAATAAKIALFMGVSSCLGQEKWLYFRQKPRRLQHLVVFDKASRGPIGTIQLLFGIP